MVKPHCCVLCKSEAYLMCMRCRDFYCSENCQVLDWPDHKPVCIPLPNLIPIKPHTAGPTSVSVVFKRDAKSKDDVDALNENTGDTKAVARPAAIKGTPNVPMRSLNVSTMKTITSTEPSVPNNLRNRPTATPNISKTVVDPAPAAKPNQPITTFPAPAKPVTITPVPSVAQPAEVAKPAPPVFAVAPTNATQPSPPTISSVSSKANHMQNLLKLHAATKKPVVSPLAKSTTIAPAAVVERVPGKWEQQPSIVCKQEKHFLVQHVNSDDPTIIWVILAQHEDDCNNMLTKINEMITSASPGVAASDIAVHQLYAIPFEDIYYRGMVLQKPSDDSKVLFRLIDYGDQIMVPVKDIKQPLDAMTLHTAMAFRVRLPKNMATPEVGDPITLNLVEDENGGYVASDPNAAAPPPPVVSVPIVSARVSAPVSVIAPAPEAPKPIVQRVYTIDDIKVIPIPENQPMQLYCLDQSDIESGFITAAVVDLDLLNKLDNIRPKINKYCNESAPEKFVLQPGQLCLSIFDEDLCWYRAICQDEVPNDGTRKHTVMFLDYGNTTKVSADQVRNIPEQFLFPTLANSCLIDGFAEHPNRANLLQALQLDPVFEIKKAEQIHDNAYVIQI